MFGLGQVFAGAMKRRRAPPRSYQISVHAKPKKIRSSSSDNPNASAALTDVNPSRDVPSPPDSRFLDHVKSPPQNSLTHSEPETITDKLQSHTNPTSPVPSQPADEFLENPRLLPNEKVENPIDCTNDAANADDCKPIGNDELAAPETGAGLSHLAGDGNLLDEQANIGGPNLNVPGDVGNVVNTSGDTSLLMVFECAQCRTTIADSSSGYNFNTDCTLVSVRGAQSVNVSEDLTVSKSGLDKQCTFQVVTCSYCDSSLGRVYTSTVSAFDHRRDVFTFNTDCLKTYHVGDMQTPSGEDVSSTKVNFPSLDPFTSQNYATLGAFEDLDAHVNTVTTAVNTMTDAIRECRRAILDIRNELSTVRNELNATKIKVNDGEEALSKLHNIVLLWDPRNRRNHGCEQSIAQILPMFRTLERRLRYLENNRRSAFTNSEVPQITNTDQNESTPAQSTRRPKVPHASSGNNM